MLPGAFLFLRPAGGGLGIHIQMTRASTVSAPPKAAKGVARLGGAKVRPPAYSLRDLQPEQDGATLCPECAAAWNVPKLPTTASVPEPTPRA